VSGHIDLVDQDVEEAVVDDREPVLA